MNSFKNKNVRENVFRERYEVNLHHLKPSLTINYFMTPPLRLRQISILFFILTSKFIKLLWNFIAKFSNCDSLINQNFSFNIET